MTDEERLEELLDAYNSTEEEHAEDIKTCNKAIAILRNGSDEVALADWLDRRALAFALNDEPKEAAADDREAIAIHRKTGDTLKLAKSLHSLGHTTNDLEPAMEAVAIYRKLHAEDPDAYRDDLAYNLNDLAMNMSLAGRHDDAIATATECVEVRRGSEDREQLALNLWTFAEVRLVGNRDLEAAKVAMVESIKIYRKLKSDQLDAALNFQQQLGKPSKK
jgi:hypothetical protein